MMFSFLDFDGDGRVTRSELLETIEKFKIPVNKKDGDIDKIMDGKDFLSRNDFFQALCKDEVLFFMRQL